MECRILANVLLGPMFRRFVMAAHSNGQAIIFLSCFFFFLFSSSNLSGRRLDVYHTSTHGVAL